MDLCKGFKIVIFPFAVFHGVHSYYTILWIFAEEQYGPGGGVDEAAGVRVRHLGQEEPYPYQVEVEILTTTVLPP
jgi:hypothetical protein